MANLTLTDLKKHAEKDGGARLNAFLDKFLTSKLNPTAKFLMVDGKKFLPTRIETTQSNQSYYYLKTDLRSKQRKTTFKRSVLNGKITSIWLANDNDLISLSQLQKTKEFGGSVGSSGGTESLAIRAETLITEGNKTKIPYSGKDAVVVCFSSADSIKNSILVGMKNNRNVSKNIIKSFSNWGQDGNWSNIEWMGNIPPNEKNQLGKYVGEVITGIMGFSNRASLHWKGFDPLAGAIKHFCVPTDPAFTGVDVFFLMNDDTIISISNKYGKGAAASFFANLLPYIMNSSKVPAGPLKDIVNIANIKSSSEQMKGRGAPSKQILYEYGFNHILGSATENLDNRTDVNAIRDPYSVYTSIKKNESTNDVDTVVDAAIQYLGIHKDLKSAETIKQELPNSLTSFFARVTAERLNQSTPINFMLKILKGKNYWQANLDQRKWMNGEISYSIFSSSNIELEIIGSKGAIKDIEMKEGMLNYFMNAKPGDPIITTEDPTL